MSDRPNPYEPPAARVADPALRIVSPRPAAVTLALFFLVLVLLIEVAEVVGTVGDRQSLGRIGMISLAVTAVLIGINAWLIVLIGRCRNWARIAFTVLFALAFVAHLSHLSQTFARPTLEILAILLQMVLQIAAVVLIYLPPASQWFRAPRE